MRHSEEQKEFLERGRFGEGEVTLARTKVDGFFGTGLVFLIAAVATIFGPTVLFGQGGTGGGYVILAVFIASATIGILLCICGLVRMRARQSRGHRPTG